MVKLVLSNRTATVTAFMLSAVQTYSVNLGDVLCVFWDSTSSPYTVEGLKIISSSTSSGYIVTYEAIATTVKVGRPGNSYKAVWINY